MKIFVFRQGRQIEAQAKSFEEEGGFTERMYRIRQQRRKQK
jgi:four helix bundle suffix protein